MKSSEKIHKNQVRCWEKEKDIKYRRHQLFSVKTKNNSAPVQSLAIEYMKWTHYARKTIGAKHVYYALNWAHNLL